MDISNIAAIALYPLAFGLIQVLARKIERIFESMKDSRLKRFLLFRYPKEPRSPDGSS